MWMLLAVDDKGKIVPSEYAKKAKAAGLLQSGGGWYYQTIKDITNNDVDMMETLDVLAQDVGVPGIFSDLACHSNLLCQLQGFELIKHLVKQF